MKLKKKRIIKKRELSDNEVQELITFLCDKISDITGAVVNEINPIVYTKDIGFIVYHAMKVSLGECIARVLANAKAPIGQFDFDAMRDDVKSISSHTLLAIAEMEENEKGEQVLN